MKPKLNHQITSAEVRIVDPPLGIMSLSAAMQVAAESGEDLIEISPQAKPPACIIQERGRWKFEQNKKLKASKQAVSEVKTIQIRPVTDEGDLQIRARQAREFIDDGHRVKVIVKFRGRELAHPGEGEEALQRLVALVDNAQLEGQVSGLEGKQINCLLVRKK